MIRGNGKVGSKNGAGKLQPIAVGEFLTVDPRVCHGELTFRGTRVPVETILLYLAEGHSLSYVRQSWPEVSAPAIQEAVKLAAHVLARRYRGAAHQLKS